VRGRGNLKLTSNLKLLPHAVFDMEFAETMVISRRWFQKASEEDQWRKSCSLEAALRQVCAVWSLLWNMRQGAEPRGTGRAEGGRDCIFIEMRRAARPARTNVGAHQRYWSQGFLPEAALQGCPSHCSGSGHSRRRSRCCGKGSVMLFVKAISRYT
jgi:hypothetical protein